jgi:two-component sensor histidine kinase
MKALLYSFLFWILVVHMYSQRSVMRHFDTKNGLPSNEVYYVNTDSKGYIWICTDAGLVKYNGNTFKQFNSANGLPDNTIFETQEDRFGRVWYFCYNGKIGYISNDSVYVLDLGKKMEEFINYGLITSIAFDEKNELYIGRRNSDHVSFLKVAPPYTADKVKDWKEKKEEKGMSIHLIGENDLVFCDARVKTGPKEFPLKIFDKDELIFDLTWPVISRTLFTRIYRKKDILYVIYSTELYRFDLKNRTFKKRSFGIGLITVTSTDEGTLLVGENHGGISYFNEDLEPLDKDKELEGLTLTYAVKDYQGGSWISTLESGIYYVPKRSISYLELPSATGVVKTVCILNDSTMVAGSGSGDIYIFNSYKTQRPRLDLAYDNSSGKLTDIYSVFPKSSNKISIRSEKGPYEFDVAKHSVTRSAPNSTDKFNVGSVTTNNGIKLYHNLGLVTSVNTVNGKEQINYHPSEDRLSSMAYDPLSNTILLSGLRGVYKFNYEKNISSSNKVLSCRTEDLKFDAKGIAYAATRAYGVIVIKNGVFDTISEKNGLISNICRSITIDSVYIWVCTNKGISKIRYDAGGRHFIQNYSLTGFIGSGWVNKVFIMGGKVVFFSGSGIYWFDKEHVSSTTRSNIISIIVNGKNVVQNELRLLEHHQSNIKINYEALLYDLETSPVYRYRISEKDPWTFTKETAITLPKLSPGDYKLEIETKSRDENWVRINDPMVISIDKAVYQKTWFIVLCIVIIAGLVFLLVKRRYKRIMEQERIKSELKVDMFELETKVVKAQMNPHFIFNSLNSIQQFILADENENAYLYLAKFSKLVRKLLESTTTENIDLKDEIDLLERYIEIEALRFENSFSYQIVVDEQLSSHSYQIPHMIIQPFVENAIWHGLMHKTGERKLKISFLHANEKYITCIIEDNGVGRSAKTSGAGDKSSLAMSFIQKRLEMIDEIKKAGCGFTVIDKQEPEYKEKGTIIEIRVPIMNT